MKVKFFGHNCFLLQGKKISVLSDPWLSDKGAFFGSWFQWPINHDLKPKLIAELTYGKQVILYISHEHQDHFDIETLNLLLPYIDKCVIPKYHDSYLLDELESIGYQVIELEDHQKYYLSDIDFIELMITDTGVNHDSTAIVNLDNEVFVNQNDCKIFDRLKYLEDKKVDYYALQFSGANWYPVCYSMEDVEKNDISKKKVFSRLVAVRNAIKLLNPTYYFPSAGPAIFPFLNKELSLNKSTIFVHQPDLIKFLEKSNTKVICLRPGEEFNQGIDNLPIIPPSITELKVLKKQLNCSFEKLNENELDVVLLKEQILLRLQKIKDLKFDSCPPLIFSWGDQGLKIDLNKGTVIELKISDYDWENEYMSVKATPAYFGLMANPKYRWQNIYLSLRATIQRKPNSFNTFINIFLYSDLSNIRSGFETTININEERIVVVNQHNGKNYEIDRFCPHNGADLKGAKIDDNGYLICPRHAWLFDLERNGKCKTAASTIDAKEIEKTITLCETISTRLLKIDN